MNPEIQNLQRQIDALKKTVSDLESSNTIPLNIDKSFMGRGFLKSNQTPFIIVSGEDAGAWLNRSMVVPVVGGMGGSVSFNDVNYPQWFLEFPEGPLAGLLMPLYVKPRTNE